MKKNNLLFVTTLVGLSMGIASCGGNAPAPIVIPVESITISGPTTVEKGQTITLTATVSPSDATNKEITWSSETPNFASVSEEGVVTAISKGSATIKATSKADSKISASYTVSVTENFSITYPSALEVEGPTKAQEGEYVEFSVLSNTAIESMKANGNECGRKGGKYYFYMPNQAVTITFTPATPSPVKEKYAITNKSASVASIDVDEAEVGATVNAHLYVNPGYIATNAKVYGNISAFDPEDRTIVPSTFADGVLSFTMPDEAVEVEIKTELRAYTLDFVSDHEDAVKQVNTVKAASGATIYTVEGNTRHVRYGTAITINLSYGSYADVVKVNGMVVDGVTYEAVDGNIGFIMPYHSVVATLTYEKVYREFAFVNSEHITLSAYEKVDDEYVALSDNKAVYGDTVYLKPTIAEGTTFEVNTITAKYSTTSVTISGPNSDGYYSFVMPKATATLNITVTEMNPSKYAGKEFVGQYGGAEFWNNNVYIRKGSSQQMSINSAGIITRGSSTYEIASVDETNKVATLTNNNVFGYASNWIFHHYNFSSDPITSDIYLYFKVEEGFTVSDYFIYLIQTKDKNYYVGQLERSGVMVDGILLNASDNSVITGVQFDFITGTKITDSEVNVDLSDANGNYICSFSGTNGANGGKSNLKYFVLDGLQGTYTGSEGDIVLDGNGGATVNGVAFKYTVNEGNVVISGVSGEFVHTYLVTLGEGTYTLVSHEEVPYTASIFSGLTFTGTYYDGWWETNSKLLIVFDEDSGDISGYVQCGEGSSAHKFVFTATYDGSTNILSIHIYKDVAGSSETTYEKDITATVSDTKIKINDDIDSRLYTTKNAEATNSDFHI